MILIFFFFFILVELLTIFFHFPNTIMNYLPKEINQDYV
jgi:hypothetical protein